MMQQFIGTKLVNARNMSRLEYNQLRGWDLPEDENGNDEGYLVEYLDGGKPNTTMFNGYVSWSPKEQFDNAYRMTSGLSFSMAIEAVKLGSKVTRIGWHDNGLRLALDVDWVLSKEEMLADDWRIVD